MTSRGNFGRLSTTSSSNYPDHRSLSLVGFSAALAIVQSDRGRQAMDRVRAISQQIEQVEEARRVTSRAALQAEARSIQVVVLLGNTSGGAAGRWRRSGRKNRNPSDRKKAQDMLRSTLYSIGDGLIATDDAGLVQIDDQPRRRAPHRLFRERSPRPWNRRDLSYCERGNARQRRQSRPACDARWPGGGPGQSHRTNFEIGQ